MKEFGLNAKEGRGKRAMVLVSVVAIGCQHLLQSCFRCCSRVEACEHALGVPAARDLERTYSARCIDPRCVVRVSKSKESAFELFAGTFGEAFLGGGRKP